MKIKAFVSQADAILSGSEQFGVMEIDVDLSTLTEPEREQLQNEMWNGKSIGIRAPTAEAVKAECERLVIAAEARRARDLLDTQRQQEKREEQILFILARPIEDLIFCSRNHWTTMSSLGQVANDARIEETFANARKLAETRNEEIEAANVARAKSEKAAQETWEADKASWIGANGSDRLKKAHDAAYAHNGAYAAERAKMELGDNWVVDFSEECRWEGRFYPSELALDMEKALKAKGYFVEIVWLTSDGKTREYDDDAFEPREAVVIRKYLERYCVIYEM